jgi:hypothetical protein
MKSGLASGELRGYALLRVGDLFLRCATLRSPWGAGPLDRLARVVRIPTLKDDYDVLRAITSKKPDSASEQLRTSCALGA